MSGDSEAAFVVPGFLANGIHVGIKETGRRDLSLLYSTAPAAAAGVFTTNSFKAAPVILDMERINKGSAQAILANSGNANAATGRAGYDDAVASSLALSARLKIEDELILVASTGIIGHRLSVDKIKAGIDELVDGLRADGIYDAEEAIMTTDKFPKIACRKAFIGSKEITVLGIAKGAGMIEPHMATLLTFVLTDAAVDGAALKGIFKQAVDRTFNAITIDGCMSTNDTAIILANGAAGNNPVKGSSRGATIFKTTLMDVMSELSQAIVKDGEGATKLIEIVIEEARSVSDAKKVAYAIANANLVKTAFFGEDSNWGRIISSAGSAGIQLPVDSVKVLFDGVPVFLGGQGVDDRRKDIAEIMKKRAIELRVKLGMGSKTFRLHTSDLSFEYVEINAHYHT
jgi:glutamate N-acetyltransferase/amino-acid N-acetyltransferase